MKGYLGASLAGVVKAYCLALSGMWIFLEASSAPRGPPRPGVLTHWKAKVLPYNFLAVRKRASLAGGLLRSKNWCDVCMNFSC